MSMALLDLEDRIITDTGSMVAKHNLLVKLALEGKPFAHLPTQSHSDVIKYHKFKKTPKTDVKIWIPTKTKSSPPDTTYEWMIPEPFNSMDVADRCVEMIIEKQLDQPEYTERLEKELKRMEEEGMESFIRCLLWITDHLRKNKIVWGLGRGSSCASLIMFLLDVNKVDPVKYNIPMEEFYK